MFIEPTITWVPSGFSGYIWLDTKIVLKKKFFSSNVHGLIPNLVEVVIWLSLRIVDDKISHNAFSTTSSLRQLRQ